MIIMLHDRRIHEDPSALIISRKAEGNCRSQTRDAIVCVIAL